MKKKFPQQKSMLIKIESIQQQEDRDFVPRRWKSKKNKAEELKNIDAKTTERQK